MGQPPNSAPMVQNSISQMHQAAMVKIGQVHIINTSKGHNCTLKTSPDHQISMCNGQCVQRAGMYSMQVDDLRLLGIPSSS